MTWLGKSKQILDDDGKTFPGSPSKQEDGVCERKWGIMRASNDHSGPLLRQGAMISPRGDKRLGKQDCFVSSCGEREDLLQ